MNSVTFQVDPDVAARLRGQLKRVTDRATTLSNFDTGVANHWSQLPFDEAEAAKLGTADALNDRDQLLRFVLAKGKVEVRKAVIEAAPKERLKLLSPFRAEVDQLSAVMGMAVGGRTTGRAFQNLSFSPAACAALATEEVEKFLDGNFDDADANALAAYCD